MEKFITATEAVRDFSTLLNKIKFSGDHYIIKRSGKSVARMLPVEEKKTTRPLKELKSILKQLPMLDDELDSFSEDLDTIIKEQPEMPDVLRWA